MGRDLSVLLAILPGRTTPTEAEASARLSPYYRFVPSPGGVGKDGEGGISGGIAERIAESAGARDWKAGSGGGGEERREAEEEGWSQGWKGPEGDEHLLSLGAFEARWIDMPLRIRRFPRTVTRAVRAARWAFWCTTRLDARDPLAAFARQLRFVSIAAPHAVAVHDPASQRVTSGERLRAVASWATPPPPTEVYQVHLVGQSCRQQSCRQQSCRQQSCRQQSCRQQSRPEQTAWVHTHGLERCGMPDIEMLRVPAHLGQSAFELVAAFVRARLGTRVPMRGSTDDLVLGHRFEWVPAEEAAQRVLPSDLGGPSDRRLSPSHTGRRIALVADARPDRAPDPPLCVLRAFDDASAVVRVRPCEAARAARLARERWSVFERLFAAHGSDDAWSFVVCIPQHTASGGSESLWWIVEEVRPGTVRCNVRNEVLDVPGLATGDERWLEVANLEDWVVYAPGEDVTPATVAVPP